MSTFCYTNFREDVFNMGRPVGGKNKNWSKEDKLRIVKKYFEKEHGSRILAKEENMSDSLIRTWVGKYLKYGEEGLENKKKTGNHFSALHTSKSLTEVEKLKLTIMKQEIEIERLKKGYQVKGVGVNKEFVSLKEMNMK